MCILIPATCLRRQLVCYNIFFPLQHTNCSFYSFSPLLSTHSHTSETKNKRFIPQAGSGLPTASRSDTKFIIHLWWVLWKPHAPVKWIVCITVRGTAEPTAEYLCSVYLFLYFLFKNLDMKKICVDRRQITRLV